MMKNKSTFISRMSKTKRIILIVCAAILVVALIAGIILNLLLTDYMKAYEKARPFYVADSYFNELFKGDNKALLYSSVKDNYISSLSEDEFTKSVDNLIDGKEVTYSETTTGLSDDCKYLVFAGDKEIGNFYVVPSGEKDSKGNKLYKRGECSLSFDISDACIIRVRAGSKLFLNGNEVDSKYIIEKGSLIAGDYEIYRIDGYMTSPAFTASLNGEWLTLTRTENTKMFSDDFFGEITQSISNLSTIRVIKGSSVFVNEKKLDSTAVIEGTTGTVDGYYRGSDKLEYELYTYKGEIEKITVSDPSGKTRELKKLAGGNIYSDDAINESGVMTFVVRSDSDLKLDGFSVPAGYITEKNIASEHNEFLDSGAKGIFYNKYEVKWVGTKPELKCTRNGVSSPLEETDGIKTEMIVSDDAVRADSSEFVENVCESLAKAYINVGGYYFYVAKNISQYFVPDTETTKNISESLIWAQLYPKYSEYVIDYSLSDNYIKYDDTHFSAQATVQLHTVLSSNGEVLNETTNYIFYYQIMDGKYLVYSCRTGKTPLTPNN